MKEMESVKPCHCLNHNVWGKSLMMHIIHGSLTGCKQGQYTDIVNRIQGI